MKKELCKAIDNSRQNTIELGTELFQNPELGFKEEKTAQKIACFLKDMALKPETGLSVTGVKSTLGKKGINICLLAEMDAIPTRGHRYASADQDAAHACGHSNQVAIMLAAFKAIKETGLIERHGGKVTFIATPAEEFTDLPFREALRETGRIDYLSGKQDMISKGTFDDVDLVISCHAMGGIPERMADVNTSLNGFIAKRITYHGKVAHAGAHPHLGVNALNGAIIGLGAVNAQRETFMDEHNIRVHGIITEGGKTVNSIPDRVVIEAMVRGGHLEAIVDANKKVNRAFEAGAYAVGGQCEIEDIQGYLPFHQCGPLSAVVKKNLLDFLPPENIKDGMKGMASGDIGDLGTIKPSIQFGIGGFSGTIHGPDFSIVDEEMAYMIPAKAIAMTVCDLLEKDGELAKMIVQESPPAHTKQSYIDKWLKGTVQKCVEGQ